MSKIRKLHQLIRVGNYVRVIWPEADNLGKVGCVTSLDFDGFSLEIMVEFSGDAKIYAYSMDDVAPVSVLDVLAEETK